jgi:hypothetical protein
VSRGSSSRGIRPVDVIVVLVVLLILACLVVVYAVVARERQRTNACANNLKQIGLALHNFHDAHRCFPGSNDVPFFTAAEAPHANWPMVPLRREAPIDPATHRRAGTNFSWLAKTLPYVEEGGHPWVDMVHRSAWDPCSDNPIKPDGMPQHDTLPCHPLAWQTSIALYRCPCCVHSNFCQANPPAGVDTNPYDPKSPYERVGITNYVALGATHSASLLGLESNPLADGSKHPNGVMYPSSRTSQKDITDGEANTLMACETREVTLAAWWEGSTAAVFGLAGEPAFEKSSVAGATYGVPVAGTRTTINDGNEKSKPVRYYLAAGPQNIPWLHGPSSFHSSGVNHLLADGNVKTLTEDIDPALYMHLITRAGGESVDAFFQ